MDQGTHFYEVRL